MNYIDELFKVFSDAIDDVSFDPDLIGDDEIWDICDELPEEKELSNVQRT